jgi:YD repeat-containing protein
MMLEEINAQFPSFNYNLTPPSPEVSSLAKFAATNVNYASGKPQITIPLYTVKSGSISIPISLDYAAGGIKVEEISSTVGLGWALNAGGIISRTVVGIGDDHPGYGYLDNNQYNAENFHQLMLENNNNPNHPYTSLLHNLNQDIHNNQLDVEPDMYFFNLPGSAGKFILNQADKKPYLIEFQKISIEYQRPTDSYSHLGEFNRWVVTTKDGTRYIFGTGVSSGSGLLKESNSYTRTDVRTASKTETTAWFLREIISANNADTITFGYTAYNTNYCNQVAETKRLAFINNYNCLPAEEITYSKSSVTSYLVTSINGRFGKVEFSYTDGRLDLSGGKKLSSIVVTNNQNIVAKRFSFTTSYFQGTANPGSYLIGCPGNWGSGSVYRLKLDSIKELDGLGQELVNTLEYDYNESTGRILPDRNSKSQDFWGYYNGESNTTLVPRYPSIPHWATDVYVLDGAKRSVSEAFATIGSLTAIKHPTGGKTTFEFESNQAYAKDFIHEVALPNEDIPYIDYASIQSNTILSPSFSGSVITTAPFTVDNLAFRRTFSYFEIGFEHPNSVDCDYDSHGTKPCRMAVSVLDAADNLVFSVPIGKYLKILPNGTYKLRMYVQDKTQWSANAIAYIKGPPQQSSLYDKKVGGLRIKRIRNYDGINLTASITKDFKYTTTDVSNTTISSGQLNGAPTYHYYLSKDPWICGTDYYHRSASSNSPLTSYSGSPVTYSRVEDVGNGNQEFLRSVYKYTSEGDDHYKASFYPFPPPVSYEHRRGLLLNEEAYKFSANQFQIVSSNQKTYLPLCTENVNDPTACPNKKWHFGLKTMAPGLMNVQLDDNPNNAAELYRVLTDWVIPHETIETTYDGNSSIEKRQTLTYAKPEHGLVTTTTSDLNNSKKEVVETKYSADYTNLNLASDVQALALKNIHNKKMVLPVENLKIIKDAGNIEFVVGGSLLFYHSAKSLIHSIYSLRVAQPVALANFTKSHINGSGLFVKDSRYELVGTYSNYDNLDNLTSVNKEGDISHSYLYGYKGLYPICQVSNATLSNIAYTSFEGDEDANWTGVDLTKITSLSNAATGKRFYNHSGFSFSKNNLLTSEKYLISYWSKNGSYWVNNTTGVAGMSSGDWTYFKHEITNPASGTITVSGSGSIDELRLSPFSAQMTTYTYDPLIGITSQCDQNSRITRYEYDSFGRLKLIRDHDNKILKTFDYKYQQNP